MRRTALLAISLFVLPPPAAFAADAPLPGAPSDAGTGTDRQITEPPPAPGPPARQAAPAASFEPTEKIKADSAISFPVDI